jgi:hypothetical protein
MRKAIAVVIGGLCVAAAAYTAAFAGTETVTGRVVDLYCYSMNKEDSGMDHRAGRECAAACAKYEAQPVGLLTAEGKVYQLAGGLVANNNAKVAPHIAHTVTVTGEVTEKDGMPMLAADDLTMVAK